jgi:hypothetical protein
MPMDCLYMQPRLHPVRRRRKNQGKSALYTEEMRYLRRFVQLTPSLSGLFWVVPGGGRGVCGGVKSANQLKVAR